MDDRSKWWDAKAVAAAIEVSERTVGRRCKDRVFECYDTNPGGKRRKWRINPASVTRLTTARQLVPLVTNNEK